MMTHDVHMHLIINFIIIHVACPAGTYLSPSNGSCSDCPANSVSEEEGLAQCMCIEGYQRAEQGEEDLPCTGKHFGIQSYSTGMTCMTIYI